MAGKKYTGPERRDDFNRRTRTVDRRSGSRGQLAGTRFGLTAGAVTRFNTQQEILPRVSTGAGLGIAQIRPVLDASDRRQGAGLRKDDFKKALKSGREVTFDLSKMKSTVGKLGKLAKHALKKAGPLGAAFTIGGIASQARAATRGIEIPKATYKGEKNLLPVTPKIRKM